ncbi:luciferase [Lentzea sp. NBRC 105346]|uniref:LLM class flavin-dependent oxidoreductase n=1 Tax=Lentzea sp. NBRC 105346 TaxID=3032205 RepID=UPI0024A52A7D|nr:LLM class flavin-dependent oxidoreductase [Lentzea sp. NBRC 105346]GLZ28965.1 luciferase [Lentzea sp. NBRC 105346]
MRVGITILPEYPWNEARARWRAADELGFDQAWTFDHIGFTALLDTPWYGALPTLGLAASVTSRIRLGTLVSSPNIRHPVSFARDVIGLDDVSGGRFTVGLGSGGRGYDARVTGDQNVRHRGKRFAEFVELLDLLLREDDVTWRGEYYEAVGARNVPGCVQRPRVPFVVAADGPGAMEVAARHGAGWITAGPLSASTLDEWWEGVASIAGRFEAPGVQRLLQTDPAPVYALSSVECFLDFAGRAGDLGFTEIAVPWPRLEGLWSGPQSIVEEVAAVRPPAAP